MKPTAAAIRQAMAERTLAYRATNFKRDVPVAERREILRRSRETSAALDSLQRAARQAFAAARGWRLSERKRMSAYPVIDHAEVYNKNGRTVAVVTHSYAPRKDILAYAARHGLKTEFLSWSWYYPGKCTAVVLTCGGSDENQN